MGAILKIRNLEKLSNQIWNTKSNFNQNEWEDVFKNMNNNLKQLYTHYDLYDGHDDVFLYSLGDTINFLDNLKIEVEERRSMEIGKLNSRQSLVAILNENDEIVEYVVCSHYTPSRPFGSQWDWGHYFTNLKDAFDYIVTEVNKEE